MPRETETKGESSSAKAMGGVLVLVAAITGIYAMVRPEITAMDQKIEFMETQSAELRSSIEKLQSQLKEQEKTSTAQNEKFVSANMKVDSLEQQEELRHKYVEDKINTNTCKLDKLFGEYSGIIERLNMVERVVSERNKAIEQSLRNNNSVKKE